MDAEKVKDDRRLPFGLSMYASCDPDKPSEFLRKMADELDGKLKGSYSSLDYKIYAAYAGRVYL